MERLTITLPAEQRAFVKAQIASGQYATESEVVRDLIRHRQGHEARERIDKMLLEAMDGPTTEVTREDLDAIWRKARERVAALQAKKAQP